MYTKPTHFSARFERPLSGKARVWLDDRNGAQGGLSTAEERQQQGHGDASGQTGDKNDPPRACPQDNFALSRIFRPETSAFLIGIVDH